MFGVSVHFGLKPLTRLNAYGLSCSPITTRTKKYGEGEAVSDDIVTRLRDAERLTRDCAMDRDDIADLLDWCADDIEERRSEEKRKWEMITKQKTEIEQLQSLVEHLSAQLRLQQKANDKAWQAIQRGES